MRLFDELCRTLFPGRCAYCGKVIDPADELCAACARSACRVPLPICFGCGRSKKDCDCGGAHNPYISAFAAPYYYDGEIREAIHRMKFKGKTDTAPVLAHDMADFAREVFRGIHFDLVTYVPMTDREKRERGLNQSLVLARNVADRLQIPLVETMEKLYETQRQRELNRWERCGNVFGAFDVINEDAVDDRRILLCDDVTTTCSTVSECAKMLKIFNAREVFCLTAAVGRPRAEQKG